MALSARDEVSLRGDNVLTSASSPAAVSSVFSQISSLQDELLPPSSLIPQLAGIPASVESALFNVASQSSLASEISGANPPDWYTSLSPDAKSYIAGISAKESSVVSQIVALEIAAGFSSITLPSAPAIAFATTTDSSTTSSVTSGTSIVPSVNAGPYTTSNTSSSLTGEASTSPKSTLATPTNSSLSGYSGIDSAGAAPVPNVFAAGFAGTVGLLGGFWVL